MFTLCSDPAKLRVFKPLGSSNMSVVADYFSRDGGCLGPAQPPGQEWRQPGPVFFAIKPDTEAAATAARISQCLSATHGLKDGSLKPELFHVTLLLVGFFPMLSMRAVGAAFDAVAAVDMREFEILFDRAETFNVGRAKNPVVLVGHNHPPGVALLRQALIAEMKRRGVPCETASGRTPHMTLLYDRRAIPAQPVEPVRWTARELALVHSHTGYSRHELLGSWRLRDFRTKMST
jgi:2'-5' RNA ligase